MSEYFTLPTAIPPASLAKSSDVNAISDAVDAGFDSLPVDLGGLKNEIIEARLGKASLKVSMADVVAYNNEQTVIATTQAGIATTQAELATTNGAAQVNLAAAQVVIATTQANNAAVSAQTAFLAPGTSSASTTSTAIEVGSKTFTTQTGKLFAVGMTVKVASTSTQYWMLGNVTSYNSGTGSLVVNVTNIDGSGTYTDWNISISAPMPVNVINDSSIYMLPVSNRTSNTILSATDKGKLISCTGSFTQTLTAASTLGESWFCYIKNAGTGVITIDPYASELIDGLTSFAMYPGEARLIQCNGTAFYTVIKETFYHTFMASASFVKPPGYTTFEADLLGAGGGGGKGVASSGSSSYGGYGGGGGARKIRTVLSSTLSATESIVVGSGGLGGVARAATAGGSTTAFGITAEGGKAGSDGGDAGYISRSGSTSSIIFIKGDFSGGTMGYAAGSVASGDSVYGGGCGGDTGTSSFPASIGGNSTYGGAGGGSGGGANSSTATGGSNGGTGFFGNGGAGSAGTKLGANSSAGTSGGIGCGGGGSGGADGGGTSGAGGVGGNGHISIRGLL